MYSGSTAPTLTKISPASRMDSSLVRAVPGTLTWDCVRTSLMRSGSFVDRTQFRQHRKTGEHRGVPPFAVGQFELLARGALVRCNSSTMASYLGLFMKLSTETCCALGV